MLKHFYFFLLLICCNAAYTQDIVRTYNVTAAQQGVAVDADFFYVVNNSAIVKYNKEDGRKVAEWTDNDSVLRHLNSGIIIDGALYCINSNFPEIPMASSLEIFDPNTLEHLDNHSFGILNGSATWVDKYNGYWYVAFAHYTGGGGEEGKSNAWTRLVKFDSDWRQIESWIYPKELIKKFQNSSNSGGVILSDGKILCTGHDNYEIYLLEFPDKGYTLNWIDTFPVGSYGQGIAIEKSGDSELIYGIIRKDKKVVVTKLKYIN
ncbi:MAG: hypothetical protein GX820_05315 [Bacteroidales bacterium]|jgi:hypothetical protein|nr:hypothetical protein [Bacteroidales bacterium]